MAHLPNVPTWSCTQCGDPWPCPDAKGDMIAEIDAGTARPIDLSMLLSSYMTDAVQDLDAQQLPDPHGRFLGWLRTAAAVGTHTGSVGPARYPVQLG